MEPHHGNRHARNDPARAGRDAHAALVRQGSRRYGKIRETDFNSIIMILTTHKELELSVLKKKLLIYDFISKFDDYEKELTVSIKSILEKLNNIKTLNFKSNKDVYQIKFNNIYYKFKIKIKQI